MELENLEVMDEVVDDDNDLMVVPTEENEVYASGKAPFAQELGAGLLGSVITLGAVWLFGKAKEGIAKHKANKATKTTVRDDGTACVENDPDAEDSE